MTDFSQLPWHWVDTQQALIEWVEKWADLSVIAIDTEFMRTNTYYAKPGLIQFATPSEVCLVDPLEIEDLSVLSPLLTNSDQTKVMHSMSEDIELLHHICGVVPVQVFDTQIAAAFLGLGPALGYQALVSSQLGEELDKSETRSDWLQRPLTAQQLDYAIKDTHFLIELYDALAPQLEQKDLYQSVIDEGRLLIEQNVAGWLHNDDAYLRLRGAWDLPPRKQQLLKKLVSWRDRMARDHNLPKSWVFSDAHLLQIAQKETRNPHALWKLDRVKPKSVKRFGDTLCQLVRDFEPTDAPFRLVPRPLKGREMELYKRLKKLVARVAEREGIAAQILGSRKMLERVVIDLYRDKGEALPEEFNGWRKPLLGEPLRAAVAEFQMAQAPVDDDEE
ncbi:MAG: ribonuclease D [Oleiphilaceae bacterium]|nr:ribonuclease D [Oleiphilaceae bacterium]